ncbi:hypothetical protein BH20ACT15_BH20ACT15_01160 [soil metagenome]
MALNDEQRSLLQLLLGGQGYEDIGSLLGTDAAQVRERAREALREVGGADPDAKVGLNDFLLGKADPIGRADAVRQLQNDPEANALASDIVSRLRLLAPSAQLPEIPPAKGGRRAATPTPAPTPSSVPSSEPSKPAGGSRAAAAKAKIGEGMRRIDGCDGRRRTAILAVAAGALIIAVVAVVVLTGGGDDGGDQSADTATTPGDEELVIVDLAPLSGGSGTGQAVFAQAQDQPLLQINLSGLKPASKNQSYIVWLYQSDRFSFPIARNRVGKNGNLTGQAPIPSQLLGLLPQFGCIDVSLASNQETQKALQAAVDGQNLPAHSGQSVLRGQIPVAPGEEVPSGADSVCNTNAAAGGGAQGQGGGGLGDAAPQGSAPGAEGAVPDATAPTP